MKTNFENFTVKMNLFTLLFLLPTFFFAQNSEALRAVPEQSEIKTVNNKDLIWNPAPDFLPGCTFTVLHGDMGQPNLDVFFKIPENTKVASHWHNSSERMILISGEMEVTYEGEATQLLKTGSYAYGPAKKPHSAKCLAKGPCVLFIALVEPFDAHPVANKD